MREQPLGPGAGKEGQHLGAKRLIAEDWQLSLSIHHEAADIEAIFLAHVADADFSFGTFWTSRSSRARSSPLKSGSADKRVKAAFDSAFLTPS